MKVEIYRRAFTEDITELVASTIASDSSNVYELIDYFSEKLDCYDSGFITPETEEDREIYLVVDDELVAAWGKFEGEWCATF